MMPGLRSVALGFLVCSLFALNLQQAPAQPLLTLFDLQQGTRALGMGSAYIGLSDDESALFYNPAGLALLEKTYAQGLFESRFGVMNYGSLALAGRHAALGLLLLNAPSVGRDDSGNATEPLTYNSFGLLTAVGVSPQSLGWALLPPGAELAFSLRAKYYRVQTQADGSGTGFALDTAFLLQLQDMPWIKSMRLGLVFENAMGAGVIYGSGHAEDWSRQLKLGLSTSPWDPLTFAFDVDAEGTVAFGLEYRLTELGQLGGGSLALRLGTTWGEEFLALNAGLGVDFQGFVIDYAHTSSGPGGSHRLSITARLPQLRLTCPAFLSLVCGPDP